MSDDQQRLTYPSRATEAIKILGVLFFLFEQVEMAKLALNTNAGRSSDTIRFYVLEKVTSDFYTLNRITIYNNTRLEEKG
ncbi:hypothetical protein METHB2_170002 [Candidatus Methylobacter favarea]|uniref:Uncharacterized protein n=1 Tax=Candidatus Methylobacter favarea TaxID=2707345 RepID=A0A8S0XER0_9GAMM|nr:hypothetical protein [Candidatus Methylobacter favarea]CAA9889984.1 hypothetical protein METHB2_170002 [Candidatus Methylobacter favarea]